MAHFSIFLCIAVAFAGFCALALYSGLAVRRYTVHSKKLTAPVRLALITDLHSTPYGQNQEKLIRAIRTEGPDAVLFAGDIVDDKRPAEPALSLFEALSKEFPCYYVCGNHEVYTGRADEIKAAIRARGVTVLEGDCMPAVLNGQHLLIAGVDDPQVWNIPRHHRYAVPEGWLASFNACAQQAAQSGAFSLLLSHRPELADIYRNSAFSLVLSGHAHGGQVRIPGIINGLFATGQGVFPKYVGGVYPLGGTTLIVSRGLCLNMLPRVFNRRELVMVTLCPEE